MKMSQLLGMRFKETPAAVSYTHLDVYKRQLISLAVYYAVVLLLGVEHYILANTLGFVISVINAYIWNSKFVFQKKDRKHGKSFVKVFVSYGSTFLLGTGFLFVLVHYWNVSEMIAPIINLLLTIPLNFLLNKFWAFK